MPNNKITKTKTPEEVKDIIIQTGTGFDSKYILGKVQKELDELDKESGVSSESFLYKAMTVFEFNKGVLLAFSLPERFRVFALKYSRNL